MILHYCNVCCLYTTVYSEQQQQRKYMCEWHRPEPAYHLLLLASDTELVQLL